jgi:hypothetical protein
MFFVSMARSAWPPLPATICSASGRSPGPQVTTATGVSRPIRSASAANRSGFHRLSAPKSLVPGWMAA